MTERYKPIACSLYDVLEAAAMNRVRVLLTISGVVREVTIRDLFTKGSEEFLVAVDAATGAEETIRLDRIELVTDLSNGKRYTSTRC